MVVKFFSNKKGGSAKAVNYLLNHREQEGTARVLQGDPQLTRKIINDIKFKQKTTVGCLSFEEKNISEEMKLKLMADFEKHLLPGMKDRYNILWVEHTDKGRLELNFVIPKIDLKTQKSLNPYYHKADLPRIEKWQDLQNLKYNYSSPKDPSKARTLQTNSKEVGLSKDYEQLDKLLHNLTEQGQINNREQLIELCEANNITITRKNKDYLSLKLPDSQKAKKFKGSIYSEEFTSTREFEAISQRAEQRVKQYNNRDTQADEQRLTRELESYTREKEQKLRKIYRVVEPTTGTKDRELKQELNSNTQEQVKYDRGNDKRETRAEQQFNDMANSDTINHRNISYNISDNILHDKQTVPKREQQNSILLHNQPQRGEINDSTRTAINKRTGTRERPEFRAYNEYAKSATELFGQLTTTAKIIREQHLENSRQLRNKPIENNEYLRIQYNTEYERNEKRTAKAREYCVRYFEANKSDFRHKYNFWRNWRELSRAVTELEKTSLGLTAGAKRIENEFRKYYHENVSISNLNFQQKIFLKNYDKLPSNSNLKGFFITKQADHIKILSFKQKVHIKDYGDKITASNTSNQDLLVKMMIDIADAKGWNLNHLNIKGSDEFIKKAKAEITNRLEKKRESERVNQYSRGYYR
ncbi:LPD7 domain-containing protein [Aliarcobacter butzleri]|uniref:LPD7 domain-containing protein n=1 Tax=Aliarcobacter butzleri TaxID=28197 RepID=UPI003AF945B0